MSGPAGDAYIEVGADTSRADREFRRWLKSLEKRGAAAGNDAGEAFGEEFSDAASASMKGYSMVCTYGPVTTDFPKTRASEMLWAPLGLNPPPTITSSDIDR